MENLLGAFLALHILCFTTNAQTLKTVEDLTSRHQSCLDSGIDMMNCSRKYCMEMDSILNVAYKSLRHNLDSENRLKLKAEQTRWLKKRDEFFEEQVKIFQKNFQSEEWGSDMFMIVYDNDAEFIRERVVELIKWLRQYEGD